MFQAIDLPEGQPKVLDVLYTEGSMVQKELATKCNVEPATMTFLLRGLLASGLVEKKAVHVSGGKRAFVISLTKEGEKRARKVGLIMEEIENAAFGGFSAEEKVLIYSLLARLTQNLT